LARLHELHTRGHLLLRRSALRRFGRGVLGDAQHFTDAKRVRKTTEKVLKKPSTSTATTEKTATSAAAA
jgi:hypothetical protein